jgi:4-amino-4-deoxy-L-arabinose transferase-like glycosyltransferase
VSPFETLRPVPQPTTARLTPVRLPAAAGATLLVAASGLVSLLYVWTCRALTLTPDEGHYWDWSRHLDWSYYSKGPLVAWVIRASCELLGPLSVALTGDLAAAVRTPAVLCHLALLAGWYVLAAGVFRSPRLGLAVVACAAVLPIIRVGAVLMTIDPPFMACWSWALVCVWKAVATGRRRWWAGAGIVTALGVLAKYTMALFPAAVVGFLLFHRRSEFRRPGVWVLLAGAVLGWVPILVWNAGHDWVSFRHVFGQVGVGGQAPARIRWDGIGQFAAGQFGMMFAFWLVAFLAAGRRFRPQREADAGVRLLWWVSVPVWGLFAVASLVKPGQPNWPAPAYVGGLVLAVAWVRERLAGERPRFVRWAVGLSVVLGLFATVALHFPNLTRPTVAKIAPPPTERVPFPVRRLDITVRASGWKELAAEVDAVRDRVRAETGQEPVVAGTSWIYPGVLGCYCSGHPQVYAIGVANQSDRYSQYDVWRPNPTADAQLFLGRTFVIVGDIWGEAETAFERHEPPRRFIHAPGGVPVAGWTIRVCHGFRGFCRDGEPGTGPRY